MGTRLSASDTFLSSSPSFAQVSGPAIPSASSPRDPWYSISARQVRGPNTPSALPQSKPAPLSAFCSSFTVSPLLPLNTVSISASFAALTAAQKIARHGIHPLLFPARAYKRPSVPGSRRGRFFTPRGRAFPRCTRCRRSPTSPRSPGCRGGISAASRRRSP